MKRKTRLKIRNFAAAALALGFTAMGFASAGGAFAGERGAGVLLGMSLPGVASGESRFGSRLLIEMAMPSFSGEGGSYRPSQRFDGEEYFYNGDEAQAEQPPAQQQETASPPPDYAAILESLAADEVFSPEDGMDEYARQVQAIDLHPTEDSGDECWKNVYLRNQSEQTYDPDSLMREKLDLGLDKAEKGPQVLIYHTHGSEAYNTTGDVYYSNRSANTKDTSRNVVAVGDTLEQTLRALGVEAVHCEKLHDESYNDAYANSRKSIEQYLEEYPTIRIIIDLHRDSMIAQSGVKYRPVAEADGMQVAQVMAVVGVGEPNEHWEDNLRFSMALCERLEEKYPGITRPMLIRTSHYNAHLSPGATLLEVGTCGNSLTEAKRTAALIGSALAELIHENGG